MVLFTWGDSYVPLKDMKLGMEYSDTFKNIGFEDGDLLLRTDEGALERFPVEVFRSVIKARYVTVLRNGQEINISIPEDIIQRVMRDNKGFAAIRFPLVIKELGTEISFAASAGLQPGDSIVCVNGLTTPTFYDFTNILQKEAGKEVILGFYRNGVEMALPVQVDATGKIGVYPKNWDEIYDSVHLSYGFFQSFPAGYNLGINTLKGYVNDMKYVFTKEGASKLGGFGAIGNLFPAVWDWHIFWMMTAFLSIILAFMNILPIPALDGGHVLFLIYEVITRRKPSDKFMEYAQIPGMVIVFGLVLYANGHDLVMFFFK
jgi:regulator of sigma E protease